MHKVISSSSLFLFVLTLSFTFCIKSFGSPEKFQGLNRYQFTYRVEIPKPEQPFQVLKAWIPLPTNNYEQKVVKKTIISNVPYQITEEKKHGNKMIFLNLSPDSAFPLKLEAIYEVDRSVAHSILIDQIPERSYWDPQSFLSMDRKVPIHGIIADLAAKETQGIQHPDTKINHLYNYVVKTMTYSKTGTGWGEGDAIWACSNKRGNCTDFHSLFVGMARSQKIPARFEIGFPIPESGEGVIPGYHCWARAYSLLKGWIPLDASEAKKTGKLEQYFGYLPSNRLHFTTGRDLVLEPPQQGEGINFFIYPYIEVNGKPSDSYKKDFFVKTLKTS